MPDHRLVALDDGRDISGQSGHDSFRNLIRLTGVYPIRAVELDCCPRALAQHQHSAFRSFDVEELLGHQVHAVLKRGYQRDIGDLVVAKQFVVRENSVDEPYRTPRARSVPLIYLFYATAYLAVEVVIGAKLQAARRDACNQHDLLFECEMPLQKKLEGLQFLQYPFGVIQPVGRQNDLEAAKFPAKSIDPGLGAFSNDDPVDQIRIYADRVHADLRPSRQGRKCLG